MLGSSVVSTAMSKGKMFGKKIIELFKALKPVLGIDDITGMPNVTVSIEPTQAEMSLKSIFEHLNHLNKEVFIAIDEFQQIANYPEKGTEALLRSHMQFLQNIRFVFSGSKQHLMAEMFLSPKRPFYQSTDMMSLNPLNEDVYYSFANSFFIGKGGGLDRDVFHELYSVFDGYTWYIQTVLNRMYDTYKKVEKVEQLRDTIFAVTENKAPHYESLAQFLTDNQYVVLKAIAREGLVKEPTGKDFLNKHKLPSASSVRTALDTLIDKELVYRRNDGYIVYDRFLNLWLRRL